MDKYLTLKKINGIIQVGANSGQEISIFEKYTNNIMLFEPNKSLYEYLKINYNNYLIYNYALGNSDEELDFYVASNNGESSSILKPKNHTILYPNVTFEKPLKIKVRRFDNLMEELKLNIDDFNVLISDTQGYELQVLKGFGNLINNIELIICEYIDSNLYENDSKLEDIKNYLIKYNFYLYDIFDVNNGAGNLVFIKK